MLTQRPAELIEGEFSIPFQLEVQPTEGAYQDIINAHREPDKWLS